MSRSPETAVPDRVLEGKFWLTLVQEALSSKIRNSHSDSTDGDSQTPQKRCCGPPSNEEGLNSGVSLEAGSPQFR